MKTIQGKEFNFEDILLYNVVNNQIIMIINDEAQMKMFNYTGKTIDAPISRVPYTKETEYEILTKMKKIKRYNKLENCIKVVYDDKIESKFDLSNEEVIKNILDAQNKIKKDVISASWSNISEEEKTERKKKANSKWKKGLAATLAALALITYGTFHKDEIAAALTKDNNNNNDSINPTENTYVISTNDSLKEQQYLQSMVYDYTELGRRLHNETLEKENLVLKYQQVVDINWDEALAINVVDFMNGKYPEALINLSNPDAFERATEIQQAWSLIVTGNINPDTREENMINFEDYYLSDQDKILVHNAMSVARNAINETIGQPMNGFIIEEGDYASVNKFSTEFINAVDQLLNYEYDTMNDPKFQEMNCGVRWLITSIFQQTNNIIPQWSYITREANGYEDRIYYRSFRDDTTGDFYYAIPGENGTVDYRCDSLNKTINEYEMFAISGTPMLEEQRNVNVQVNPNLHQVGIQVLVDNAFNEATEDIYNLRTYATNLYKGTTK